MSTNDRNAKYGESSEGLLIGILVTAIVGCVVGAFAIYYSGQKECRAVDYIYCDQEVNHHGDH